MEPAFRTKIGSNELNSESEVSTDQESPDYFKNFYLQFGMKIDDGRGKMSFVNRKGAAFDFKERTVSRLEDHIDQKHWDCLLEELDKLKVFCQANQNLFKDVVVSLVLIQQVEDGEFEVLMTNPNKVKGVDLDNCYQGIEELQNFLRNKSVKK